MSKVKIAVAGIVVLGAAAAGGTYYAGQKAQTDIKAAQAWFVNDLVKPWAGDKVRIENASYSQGLFSSESRFDVVVQGIPGKEGATLEPVRLPVRQLIQHGPLVKSVDGWGTGWYNVEYKLDLSPFYATAPELKKWVTDHPDLVTIGYKVAFNGERQGYLSHRELKADQNGEYVEIAPSVQRFTYSEAMDRIAYDINLPKVVIKGKDKTEVTMEGLHYVGETTPVQGKLNFLNGGTEFHLAKLLVNYTAPKPAVDPVLGDLGESGEAETAASDVATSAPVQPAPVADARKQLQLEDLHFKFAGTLKDEFFDLAYNYGLGNCVQCPDFAINKKPVKSVELAFSLNHFHAPSLSAMNDSLMGMYKTTFLESMQGNPRSFDTNKLAGQAMGMGMVMLANLTTLAKKDPEINISKFSLKTADGAEASGNMVYRLKGLTDQDIAAGNVDTILKRLFAEGKATIPESLIEPASTSHEMIAKMVKAGWVKQGGGNLQYAFKFEGGKISIFDKQYQSVEELKTNALTMQQ